MLGLPEMRLGRHVEHDERVREFRPDPDDLPETARVEPGSPLYVWIDETWEILGTTTDTPDGLIRAGRIPDDGPIRGGTFVYDLGDPGSYTEWTAPEAPTGTATAFAHAAGLAYWRTADVTPTAAMVRAGILSESALAATGSADRLDSVVAYADGTARAQIAQAETIAGFEPTQAPAEDDAWETGDTAASWSPE